MADTHPLCALLSPSHRAEVFEFLTKKDPVAPDGAVVTVASGFTYSDGRMNLVEHSLTFAVLSKILPEGLSQQLSLFRRALVAPQVFNDSSLANFVSNVASFGGRRCFTTVDAGDNNHNLLCLTRLAPLEQACADCRPLLAPAGIGAGARVAVMPGSAQSPPASRVIVPDNSALIRAGIAVPPQGKDSLLYPQHMPSSLPPSSSTSSKFHDVLRFGPIDMQAKNRTALTGHVSADASSGWDLGRTLLEAGSSSVPLGSINVATAIANLCDVYPEDLAVTLAMAPGTAYTASGTLRTDKPTPYLDPDSAKLAGFKHKLGTAPALTGLNDINVLRENLPANCLIFIDKPDAPPEFLDPNHRVGESGSGLRLNYVGHIRVSAQGTMVKALELGLAARVARIVNTGPTEPRIRNHILFITGMLLLEIENNLFSFIEEELVKVVGRLDSIVEESMLSVRSKLHAGQLRDGSMKLGPHNIASIISTRGAQEPRRSPSAEPAKKAGPSGHRGKGRRVAEKEGTHESGAALPASAAQPLPGRLTHTAEPVQPANKGPNFELNKAYRKYSDAESKAGRQPVARLDFKRTKAGQAAASKDKERKDTPSGLFITSSTTSQ